MKRKYKVYLYTYFGPCMLMVITSWISFTVDSAAVPGRLGLLLTLLLMMINLNNSVSSTIPKSTKVTPLTAWIMVSIGFVSFALLEYAVILYTAKFVSEKQRKETKKVKQLWTREQQDKTQNSGFGNISWKLCTLCNHLHYNGLTNKLFVTLRINKIFHTIIDMENNCSG